MINKNVRIFLKYNNDNNPFYIATITPLTVLGGLTRIGGYITIFGLLKIALFLYNRHSFENKLLKKYKSKIRETLDEDDAREINKDTVRELMSYEMLMQLVLTYLKERRQGGIGGMFRASGRESLNQVEKKGGSTQSTGEKNKDK